jgi:cyclophilin family peptidyl-prolyl cis-trans isomerase
MVTKGRFYLLSLMCSTLFAAAIYGRTEQSQPPQADEPRTALVIGNATYAEGPLRNPANDAQDLTAALRQLGFRVTSLTNASKRQMEDAIRQFGQDLRRGGTGLFFFSGHGVQSKGENYIIPISADIRSEADLAYEGVNLGLVLDHMDQAQDRLNIVIVDACRNSPFSRSFRDATRGLAVVSSGHNLFIAFATGPGQVAADGTGRNSPYTAALLESLRDPQSRIDDVFRRASQSVVQRTSGTQIPWVSQSFFGDFWFDPRASRPAQPAVSVASAPTPAISDGQPIAPVTPPARPAISAVVGAADRIGQPATRPAYAAHFETSMGNFTAILYEKEAPNTVANFVGLAEGTKPFKDPRTGQQVKGKPFYDGLTFHRIVDGFIIQGGDPLGNGTGTPGFTIKDEVNSHKHDRAGVLAMAKTSQPNSQGSQFYITLTPQSQLDRDYTVFGQIVEGMEVVRAIGKVKTSAQDRPLTSVVIKKVTIEKRK